ncbi:MAG: hypothetical protein MR593_02440 [Intestinibacter sp.]|uniref:hypothetical protein n=1 Tax=Intestinibacter sp. TaxID=1965304 RepID=UPI0025BB41A2|nr:hypothetical protein [Intestinibacter sp.]MCI6736969.1 hypothetical protein [Intestinibacter sp.]
MKNKKRNCDTKNNEQSQNNNTNSQSNNTNEQTQSKLCYFSSTDYIVLASTLAIALGEELSQIDLNILSTFFAVLSDELALITAVQSCNTGEEEIFVPPVPDVAVTSPDNKSKSPKRKRCSKKIVKRKIKKK